MHVHQLFVALSAFVVVASALPSPIEKRDAEPAVEYYNSIFPKAEKRDAEPAVEYYNSIFPKAEKRAVRDADGKIEVDESELACCLLSDARCVDLVRSNQLKKRSIEYYNSIFPKAEKRAVRDAAGKIEVDESQLACCLISDPDCEALLKAQGL